MLHVENTSRGITLVNRGRVADNFWTRLKGLIGVRELADGDGLLIIPCKGVHCMFMSVPIDVLYINKDARVVAIDTNMQPWRMGRIYKASHCVIELSAGTVARSRTAVGDQLQIRRL